MNQPGNNFDEWAQPSPPDTAYLPPQGGPAPQAAPVSPEPAPPAGANSPQYGAQSFAYPPNGGGQPPGQPPVAGYPPPGMYPPQQPEPKKKSNVVLVVLAIILGLVLIAVLIWAFFQIRGGEEDSFAAEPLEVVAAEDSFQDEPAVAVETVDEPAPAPASAPSSSDLSQYGFPAGTSCPSGESVRFVTESTDGTVRAAICENSSGSLTYRGYTTGNGLSPVLSAFQYSMTYQATNGSTTYNIGPDRIKASNAGNGLLDTAARQIGP
ncbi:hypothetical protein [Corynebacterium sputi]|uniref:hypothetical protein n=1 Tax=Corynebacterium sputi TaxID=489915 RepID=UPI0012EB51E6|nr:hypothetical protein [Corynebacterium sputi]